MNKTDSPKIIFVIKDYLLETNINYNNKQYFEIINCFYKIKYINNIIIIDQK